MSTTAADYCNEFFDAAHLATRTHEEWLLRICSQMMQREAAAVRMLEEQARYAQPSPEERPIANAQPRARKWRRASRHSATSTAASMETDAPSCDA